jgi:hypothetical protein
MDIANPINNSP